MKRKKDIGIIIQFDDKEYSKEETIFLYQRFISILLEASFLKKYPRTTKYNKKEA